MTGRINAMPPSLVDPYDLQRFVDAQEPVFERVMAELASGRKTSHWMWFVFPQLQGLGRSRTAEYYGIGSAEEAHAYWQHPVLGPRLKTCVAALLAIEGRSATEVLGTPDDFKLRSCLTLFAHVAPEESAFRDALARYFEGAPDPTTLARLSRTFGG